MIGGFANLRGAERAEGDERAGWNKVAEHAEGAKGDWGWGLRGATERRRLSGLRDGRRLRGLVERRELRGLNTRL